MKGRERGEGERKEMKEGEGGRREIRSHTALK